MANNLNKKRKSWLPIHKENWFGDWFDPHESYLRLPSFWWPFTIIMISVALVSWKVIHDQELVWGLASRVEQWYEWFQIPLWVLALLIPVLGLFNANHKSEQTRASMELTKSQNKFANFYKHLEEFQKYMIFAKDSSVVDFDKINLRKMHNMLFPNSQRGTYDLRKPELDHYCELVELLVQQIYRAAKESGSRVKIRSEITTYRTLLTLGLGQENILKHASANPFDKFGVSLDVTVAPTEAGYMEQFHKELVFFYKVLSFDTLFDEATIIKHCLERTEIALKSCLSDDDGTLILFGDEEAKSNLRTDMNFLIDSLNNQKKCHREPETVLS